MKSQNGWPIVGKSACDQGPFQGVTFPNGILAGDVATIARWQLARYEADVEPLVPGSCWGWLVKEIQGSDVPSNHGSATAWDVNASKYPLGTPASKVMTSAKIEACRGIVADSGRVLRWGGDYVTRPDVMHWEVVGTPAEAAEFANRIRAGLVRGGEGPMLVKKGDTGEQVKFWQHVLTDAGYSPGEVDGDYGTKTAAAIAKFRKDRGVTTQYDYLTGWTGYALLGAMMDKRVAAKK